LKTHTSWNLTPDLLDMLVEEGLISSSAVLEIQAKASAAWVPIGMFLRQRGHLTMKQLIHLLELQTSEPYVRLGELAVREGLCTEEDVPEALRLQREASPHPLDLLLSEPRCDREQLCRVLIRYIRQLEPRTLALPVGA
jgi:hypothetical protein